jgi:hypothetical protein
MPSLTSQRRRYTVLLAGAAALMGLGGCQSRSIEWQPYQPNGSALSVELPGAADVTTTSLDLNYGFASMETSICELDKDEAYMLAVVTLPAGRSPYTEDELLDRMLEGERSVKNVAFGDRRPTSIGGYGGTEMDVSVGGSGNGLHRIYLIEGKIYMVMAVGRGPGYPERQEHFLNSLHVTVAPKMPAAPKTPRKRPS